MQPFEGLRVIEMATHVVVPAAARILSDWGAEVIKIEMPGGERWRTTGRGLGLPVSAEENPIFTVPNSGKEMISLNLKTEEGREVLFRLLEDADVFLTNVRWAAIQRMGLDYDTLHKRFPKLVYFHFNGFGYEGPEASRPGFDSAAFWSMPGSLGELPQAGDRPMSPPGAFGDMVTANAALSGIVGALYHRERTGEGLRVTTSLYAAGLWCNFYNIIACQSAPGVYTVPRKAEDTRDPLGEIYQCADGRWLLVAITFEQFSKFLKALDLDELIGDARFSTLESLMEHSKELFQILTGRMLTRTSDEWCVRLREADVVYQKLMTSVEAATSEQAWANGYLSKVKFPSGVEITEPNTPVSFFGWERPATKPAHRIGQDTRAVLTRFGYSPDEIQALMEGGIALGE